VNNDAVVNLKNVHYFQVTNQKTPAPLIGPDATPTPHTPDSSEMLFEFVWRAGLACKVPF
jgi:hypothetical protein